MSGELNQNFGFSKGSLASQGFVMPPEWDRHCATLMAWPHNRETWPHNLAAAQREYVELLSAIADDEPVLLLCHGNEETENFLRLAEQHVQAKDNVQLLNVPTNDAWVRDYGPTFVVNQSSGTRVGVDWKYDAWGGKYPPFDADQAVAGQVCQWLSESNFLILKEFGYQQVDFCIEGGALEINEEGVLLCTKSCALNSNRNQNVSQALVESKLRDQLGANSVVWLSGDGLEGDDTDGHIDQLARFTPSGTVLIAEDRGGRTAGVQSRLLKKNREDLVSGLDSIGTTAEVVGVPLPNPIELFGQRLPASYCNFYITHHKVIVPQFGQASDRNALKVIEPHFPNHEVVGLVSTNLCFGQGSFHCLTQQVP